MAARINRHHTDQVLERIKLANLVQRLQMNALGTLKNRRGEPIEMTDGQIRSTIFLCERRLAKAEMVKQVNLTGQFTLFELIARATSAEPAMLRDDGDTPLLENGHGAPLNGSHHD